MDDIQLALFNPEIPQNTGNIARLSAGFLVPLHIVGEAKFSMTEKALRRSGVDYWHLVDLTHQASVWHLLDSTPGKRVVPVTTRGKTPLAQYKFEEGDILAFGNESSGLPAEIHRDFGAHSCRIEQWGDIRSLNLATAVGIVLWEALRQLRTEPDSESGVDSRE
ncbi:MAG: tRNA (cytidine/uridine-2'-O-)-methyltransferase [Planctomycetota bacterium]|jgi:tRNA (cytidine/uridine-2'-O-)-methyltransferase